MLTLLALLMALRSTFFFKLHLRFTVNYAKADRYKESLLFILVTSERGTPRTTSLH